MKKKQVHFGVFIFVGRVGPSQEQKGLPVTAVYLSPSFEYRYS